jgi:hypothetical protein
VGIIREIPQSTKGRAPFVLAFGFELRGPISILKDSWSGVKPLPLDLAKPVVDYLCDLRERLAAANQYANAHMKEAQYKWASRYNLRARDKKFEVGEQVLILVPDSTQSRVWSSWRAPATVVDVKSPYSYVVEIDSVRQHVHANKLPKYHVRVDKVVCDLIALGDYCAEVNNCLIIFDQDVDFGPVDVFIPTCANEYVYGHSPSEQTDASKLDYLTDEQCSQFLTIIDRYPECFVEKPSFCNVLEHEIHVTPDFRPKRLKEYHILSLPAQPR